MYEVPGVFKGRTWQPDKNFSRRGGENSVFGDKGKGAGGEAIGVLLHGLHEVGGVGVSGVRDVRGRQRVGGVVEGEGRERYSGK